MTIKSLYKREGRNGAFNEIISMGNLGDIFVFVAENSEGKEWCGCFDGLARDKTSGKLVHEALQDFISEYGIFSLETHTSPRMKNKNKRIEHILFRMYHGFDDTNIAIVGGPLKGTVEHSDYTKFVGCGPDVAEYFKDNNVVDLGVTNIQSDKIKTYRHSTGFVINGVDSTIVTYNGIKFYTDGGNDICRYLRRVEAWELNNDTGKHLHLIHRNVESCGRRIKPSFAFLVDRYAKGITYDLCKRREPYVDFYHMSRKDGKVIDHMTGNTFNNFSWGICETTQTINYQLGSRRTSIVEPYYFYNVNDRKQGKILVECGIVGYGQLWQFAFPAMNESFVTCFNEFCKGAQDNNHFENGARDRNLLHFWGDPERANDLRNPVTALLREPIERFKPYKGGEFKNLIRI